MMAAGGIWKLILSSPNKVTPCLCRIIKLQGGKYSSSVFQEWNFETENRPLIIKKNLEHLRNDKVIVNCSKVKNIQINDQFGSKGSDGASLFLYERIPQIKFHNPDLPISCTRDPEKPWKLEVNLINEDSITIMTEGKNSEDIYREFCKIVSAEEDKCI